MSRSGIFDKISSRKVQDFPLLGVSVLTNGIVYGDLRDRYKFPHISWQVLPQSGYSDLCYNNYMKLFLIPFIVLLVDQVIKFFVIIWKKRKIYGNRFVWSFIWAGQFPSAHTALIASCDTIIWRYYGAGPLFVFCFFVSLVLIYNLVASKKHEILMENYFSKSGDKVLVKIVKDQILMDFSGHTLTEILAGGVLGIVLTLILLGLQ